MAVLLFHVRKKKIPSSRLTPLLIVNSLLCCLKNVCVIASAEYFIKKLHKHFNFILGYLYEENSVKQYCTWVLVGDSESS